MNILEDLLNEERELVFEKFNNDDALKLGLMIIEYSKANNISMGVKIERNRQVLFSHLMDGTCYENQMWYNRKKNVIDRYFHSSKFVKEMFLSNNQTFSDNGLLDEEFYQAEGGSFPLTIKGTGVVGSITVCGLSGDEDHEICVKMIREFLNK